MDGARRAGHEVEKVSLKDKTIGFCKGCLACQKTGSCVIRDDAGAIVEKMLHADVLVFATPIYYYEMSGQMKTMLDRVWGMDSLGHAATVTVHINRLRDKLGKNESKNQFIETVWGAGYRFWID